MPKRRSGCFCGGDCSDLNAVVPWPYPEDGAEMWEMTADEWRAHKARLAAEVRAM